MNVARDAASCGACGSACAIATDICVDGSCTAPAVPSDGSMGAFAPSADVELPAGVYHFTTITIPAGVTVRTDGVGRLELRATGAVVIDGVVDLSGGDGAPNTGGVTGGGGTTGVPLDGLGGTACTGCCPAGVGGDGAPGGSSALHPDRCGEGGVRGGGAGGLGSSSGIGSGGGGGGYAGGSGGGRSVASGAGASVAGLGTGAPR
ncbi:MAG: hypothetical protein M5U28_51815 [Sandaracinaceae bacterium]|nr:hypothetical protein [Sandaracinaceae bacterium]